MIRSRASLAAAAQFDWDGVNREGTLLDNGFYNVRFVWTDPAGAAHRSGAALVALFFPDSLRDFLGPHVRLVHSDDGLIIRLAEVMAFAPGRWALRPAAEPALEKVCAFLKRYPRNRLVVQGHADATGTPDFNQSVSRKRAFAIYRFLSERGGDPSRMSYEGLGASKPVSDNSTARGREQSRRVEIVLLRATI